MIYKEKELQEAIGSKNIEAYLMEKGYKYVVIGNKEKKLYLIEDKLKLKQRTDIEEVLKQEYSIDDSILDGVVDMLVWVYKSKESISIKDLVVKDRAVAEVLLEKEVLMFNYYNYNVQIKYSLLTKILEV